MSDSAMRRSLDRGIFAFFSDAIRVALRRPAWAFSALRIYLNQRAAARNRASWLEQGVAVPPLMILSVTNRCNLKCAGCYAKALHSSTQTSLSSGRLVSLLSEARELGISTVLLAGGEPLTREDLFDVMRQFPDQVFALFTNGTLVDDTVVRQLRARRNVIPLLSIEGNRIETDHRRGEGIFSNLESTMASFQSNGIFYGCSVTVTRANFDIVLDHEWIRRLYKKGCRLFIFVEYVPVDAGSEELALTQEQRTMLIAAAAGLRKKINALFVAFPGDEDQFGGCLASGRGFIHVSPSGDLEPCPFAPYSDRNIVEMPLKRALRSPLLEKIRENHGSLQETSGGCALWTEREWVASLVQHTRSS